MVSFDWPLSVVVVAAWFLAAILLGILLGEFERPVVGIITSGVLTDRGARRRAVLETGYCAAVALVSAVAIMSKPPLHMNRAVWVGMPASTLLASIALLAVTAIEARRLYATHRMAMRTRYDGMALVSRLDPKARYRQYGSPAAPSNEAASCRGGSRRDDRDHDVWRLRAGLLAHDLRAVLAWAHDVKDVPCSQIDLGEVESLRGIASIAQNRRLPVYHADGAAFLDVTDMPEELASPLLRYLGETAGYDPSVPYQQQSSPEPDRQHGYILFAARPSLRDFLA